MTSNSFYMTLPSNVHSDSGGFANKTSQYKTNLIRSIELYPANSWEVAVVQWEYPVTWYNLTDGDVTVIKYTKRVACPISRDLNQPKLHFKNKMEEPVDFTENVIADSVVGCSNVVMDSSLSKENYRYETGEFNIGPRNLSKNTSLIKLINSKIPRNLKAKFTYHASTNKCSVRIEGGQQITFHPNFARMLGFADYELNAYSEARTFTARFIVDLNAGFDHLFLYSDCIKPSVVGNIEAPLLRTVPVQTVWGRYQSHIFEHPHYYTVALTRLQEIEISIRSDSGNLVQFEKGKVVVTLHFRKKSIFPL